MVCIGRGVLVLVMAGLATLLPAVAPEAATPGGTITVQVRSASGQPVEGLEVAVVNGAARSVTTDRSGNAQVTVPESGIFHVLLSGPGKEGSQSIYLPPGGSETVRFPLDDLPAGFAPGPGTPGYLQNLERREAMYRRAQLTLEEAISRYLPTVLDNLPREVAEDLRKDLSAARNDKEKEAAVTRAIEHPLMQLRRATDRPAYDRDMSALERLRFNILLHAVREDRLTNIRRRIAEVREAREPRGAMLTPFPGAAGSGGAAPGTPGFPFRLQPGVGAAFFDVPRINYGTQVIAPGVWGTERAIGWSSRRITGVGGGLRADVPLTPRGTVSGQFFYKDGSAEATASVPPGGTPVASVYLDRAPDGSTSLFLGNTGAAVTIDTWFRKYSFDATYSYDVSDYLGLGGTGVQVTGGAGIAYWRTKLWHDAMQTSPTFPGIRSEAEMRRVTNLIGPRLELGIGARVDRFSMGGTGYVVPGFLFSSGSATQRNLCDLCWGFQRNFTIEREEEKSDFGVRVGFTARLGLTLGANFQVGVTGGFEYADAGYTWKIPVSPLDQPARLARASTTIGFAGLYVRFP